MKKQRIINLWKARRNSKSGKPSATIGCLENSVS